MQVSETIQISRHWARHIPLSHFWISAACGENINFALPPLLELGLTKSDFSPKSQTGLFSSVVLSWRLTISETLPHRKRREYTNEATISCIIRDGNGAAIRDDEE